MSDQCRYCEAYEKLNLCKSFDCFHHESWYAKEQSKLIAERDATIAELRELLDEAIMPKWVSVDERLPAVGMRVELVRKEDGERVLFTFTQHQADTGKTHLYFTHWLCNTPPAPEV